MQTRLPLSRRRPVRDTLAVMSSLVRQRRSDERVRSTALTIAGGAPPRDDSARMARVVAWVKAAMPYERDPVGSEAINDPLLTLEKIYAYAEAAGDCDDAATLVATLLESLGVKTRLVAVSVRRDRRFHHVGVEAFDRLRARWMYLDPFAPGEVGSKPSFTAAMRAAV